MQYGNCGQINTSLAQAIQNLIGSNGFQNNANGAQGTQNVV